MRNTAVGRRLSDSSQMRKLFTHRIETIRMEAKRFGYFPQTLVWHGRRYEVHTVERSWTVSHRWTWNVERHYFRVRCAEGVFDLYQDAKHNTWHVDHFEPASNGSDVVE